MKVQPADLEVIRLAGIGVSHVSAQRDHVAKHALFPTKGTHSRTNESGGQRFDQRHSRKNHSGFSLG